MTQKNIHISGCKIVHLCTIATVTVHICTVIVALAFIILHFFLSPYLTLSFSTSTLTSLSFISGPSVQPHRHGQYRKEKRWHLGLSDDILAGTEDRLVMYFTSLRRIRWTYEDCYSVRMIFRGFWVWVDERDLSLDSAYRKEL